jgi:ribosome-associated protein
MDIRKLQRAIVDGLEDVKAQDIAVFNTEHLTPLFERVIVASGTSNRQTKALASSVRDAVRAGGFQVLRTEGESNGEWIIVDCGAAVAHIMQPDIRRYYHLEEIWGDKPVALKRAAVRGLVKAEELAPEPVPARSARKAAPKASAGGTAAKTPARKTAAKAPARKAATNAPARPASSRSAAAKSAPAKAPAARKPPVKANVTDKPSGGKSAAVGKPIARKPAAVGKPAHRKPAASQATGPRASARSTSSTRPAAKLPARRPAAAKKAPRRA